LRTPGVRLLRIPKGLVLEDPQEFARKVRGAAGATLGQGGRGFKMETLTRPSRDERSATLSPGRGLGLASAPLPALSVR
jgi:hypothetical protein